MGHYEWDPPRTVVPDPIIVDPPPFAFKADAVFDISDIKGRLTIDGGSLFETEGDKVIVHNEQGTNHTGALSTLTIPEMEGNKLQIGTDADGDPVFETQYTQEHVDPDDPNSPLLFREALILEGLGLRQGTALDTTNFSGVEYKNFEDMEIRLGDSADTFTINTTHAETTTLVLGGGNDTANVKSISGDTTILGGAGSDTVNVFDDALTVGGIDARLTFEGNGHRRELIENVPFTGQSVVVNSPTVLTPTGEQPIVFVGAQNEIRVNVVLLDANGRIVEGFFHDEDAGGTKLYFDAQGDITTTVTANPVLIPVNEVRDVPLHQFPPTIITETLVDPAGVDVLNVNNTNDASPITGSLIDSTLRLDDLSGGGPAGGMGPSGLIDFTGLEDVNITLGGGADFFTVYESLHAGAATPSTGGGVDTVRVKRITGDFTVNTGSSGDTINVGSDGNELEDIGGVLTIVGSSGLDILNIDDSGTGTGQGGTLTASRLTGLGMGGRIDYTAEDLHLDLGAGGDTLTVESTHAGNAAVNAHNGADTINVETVSGLTTINTGNGGDTVNVGDPVGNPADGLRTLAGISAPLILNGDLNSDTLNIDNSGATVGQFGVLTDTTLTGLGMGAPISYGTFETLNLDLGMGSDSFNVASTIAGATNIRTGKGNDSIKVETLDGDTFIFGDEGNDDIILFDGNGDAATAGATLSLDGGRDDDLITLNLGRLKGLQIGVQDSGGLLGGFNELVINGTDGSDFFFLDHGPDNADASDGVVEVGVGGGKDHVDYRDQDLLTINGLDGADAFKVDDNAVATVINMGEGDDVITIGTVPLILDDFGVPVADLANTTNGTSALMTVNGGAGNDNFEVNRNLEALFLNGDDGDDDGDDGDDDIFVINTFLVKREDPNDPDSQILNLTSITGGAGSDQYEYLQNAPVFIDGGDGFDTVVLNGTPIGDVFVVTDRFTVGAGRQVFYENIERFELNAAGGDDEIYVLSTSPAIETIIRGGTGDDEIHLGGDHPAIPFDPEAKNVPQADFTVTEEFSETTTVVTPQAAFTVIVPIFQLFNLDALEDSLGGDITVQNINFQLRCFFSLFGQCLVSGFIPVSATLLVQPPPITSFVTTVTQVETTLSPPPVVVDPDPFVFKLASVNDLTGIKGKLVIDGGTSLDPGTGLPNQDNVIVHNDGGGAIPGALTITEAAQREVLRAQVFEADGTPVVNRIPVLNPDGTPAVDDNGDPIFEDVPVFETVEEQVFDAAGEPVLDSNDEPLFRPVFTDVLNADGSAATQTFLNLTGLGAGSELDGTPYDGVEIQNFEDIQIRLGTGGDDFTIETIDQEGAGAATYGGTLTLVTGDGNDHVRVKEIAGTTTILGGRGGDTVDVWDDDDSLAGIQADLIFNGDQHLREEAVPVPVDTPGLGQSSVFFVEGGVVKAPVAVLNPDGTVLEQDVHATTDLVSGLDNLTPGALIYFDDAGQITTTPTAVPVIIQQPVTVATPVNLAEKNIITEYFAGNDFLHVRNDGVSDNVTGALTPTQLDVPVLEANGLVKIGADGNAVTNPEDYINLDVLGMPGQIFHSGRLETLQIDLGAGNDLFEVEATIAATFLNTGGGNDEIRVTNPNRSLDGILGYLHVDAQGGANNVLVVDDSGDPDADYGVVITDSSITGLAPAKITYGATGGNYKSLFDSATGTFSSGVEISAGTGLVPKIIGFYPAPVFGPSGNIIAIQSTRNDPGVIEVTTVNAGAGDDTVTITEPEIGGQVQPHRYLVVHGQTGMDTIDATATSEGVTVFGDEDDDLIRGGAGTDVLVGGLDTDNIFGNEGDDVILGDRAIIVRDALYRVQRIETRDENNGARDILDGSGGNDVILGGAGDDDITANQGGNIILGDNGVVVRDDGSPEANDVFSRSTSSGGNDTITGGSDNVGNILIGGDGTDTITGGIGNDVILGDNGYVTRDANNVVTKVETADEDGTTGGDDVIDSFAGDNVILGGTGKDTITAPIGNNIILGDNGEVNLNSADSNDVFSKNPAMGDTDTITGGNGSNIILGGAAGDVITGGLGNDVILGDSGRVTRDGNEVVLRVETIDDATGGVDEIDGGDGDDVILGGAAGDVITAALGGNIILGDAGEANLNNADSNDVFTTNPAIGGADTIIGGGNGSNIIIGGALGDFITGGIGNDVILGDGGRVTRDGNSVVRKVKTIDDATGGVDEIDGGDGDDVILGGAAGDVITAALGGNIILGDAGEANLNNADSNDVFTTSPAIGGIDIITGGANAIGNIIIGGAFGDIITGGLGNDVILGDNGEVNLNSASNDVFTTEPDVGGTDTITGGAGANIILGRALGDLITGGDGNDVILGDGGRVTRDGNEVVLRVETIDDAKGGVDDIDGGAGDDVILGGAAGDVISAEFGNNIILGDNGEVNLNSASNDVFTTEPDIGGTDTITGGDGANIILGGALGDLITGGFGNDVILGDNGYVTRGADNVVTKVVTGDADGTTGGDDEIDSFDGDNVILGGTGEDTITAPVGNNIILGDNGEVNLNNPDSNDIFTTEPDIGGVDTIIGGDGANIILGGALGDFITGGIGNEVILGDNGRVTRGANNVVTRIETGDADGTTGGVDEIDGGDGDDVILGGAQGDLISAASGRTSSWATTAR